MDVVRLSRGQRRLLTARFAEHDNSFRRMAGALEEAGATARLDELRALRRLERRFSIDLGSLCHRWERRDADGTHPLERVVLDFVTETRPHDGGGEELWVLIDRVRQVRELIDEGQLVREPES